jgi:hypothetical protein
MCGPERGERADRGKLFMNAPNAYPLQWPAGWPKTSPAQREKGKFKTTLAGALSALNEQLRMLGAAKLVLSSNYTLGVEKPQDPGVVAYFNFNGTEMAIPCDRWDRVEHNVKAIALTVEAMRGMERWGAKNMIRAMFTGFKTLMAPGHRPWWEVMGLTQTATKEAATKRYHDLAKERHPDNTGGNPDLMASLNVAWDEAKRERGWT